MVGDFREGQTLEDFYVSYLACDDKAKIQKLGFGREKVCLPMCSCRQKVEAWKWQQICVRWRQWVNTISSLEYLTCRS